MSAIFRLTLAFFLMISLHSYAQPGDLTHPAQHSKSEMVFRSTYTVFDTTAPLIIYDGISLHDIKSLPTFDAGNFASVKTDRNFLKARPNEKFLSLVEITTISGINEGLKHIKAETKNWIKENPLAVIFLNKKLLDEDQEKLDNLLPLKPEEIKEILTLNYIEGSKLLGEKGKNGVMVINTN